MKATYEETCTEMLQSIFFAHSAGPQQGPGQGSYDFVQWLRGCLDDEQRLQCPIIQDPDSPAYATWKTMLDEQLAAENGEGDITLIGHSLGGSMLLKYISEHTISLRIKALLLVAVPLWGSDDWEVEQFALSDRYAEQLPELPSIHIFHCVDDPVVPYAHAEQYNIQLPHARLHKLDGDDHAFANGLPELAELLKKLK